MLLMVKCRLWKELLVLTEFTGWAQIPTLGWNKMNPTQVEAYNLLLLLLLLLSCSEMVGLGLQLLRWERERAVFICSPFA